MVTVAESVVTALAEHGVTQMWGVVGDALNPVTDAIRTDGRIEWIGVRHEEAAAFAVSAQAQLTGRIGVCLGTVGPGSIHLLNGLYDAKKSHAPVLAICGQVPSEEIGSDFFQEVDNDRLFADVGAFDLEAGGRLPAVRVAYETWGTLNADGSNAFNLFGIKARPSWNGATGAFDQCFPCSRPIRCERGRRLNKCAGGPAAVGRMPQRTAPPG